MARMVRKQVYIAPQQEALLKRRAKERGVSEAQLIREGINHILHTPISLPRDRNAWEEAQQVILERMRLTVPQTGRTWTREELYDKRLRRLSH